MFVQLYKMAAERRERLLRARARAQFSRDANEARGWLADKLAMLNAQHGMYFPTLVNYFDVKLLFQLQLIFDEKRFGYFEKNTLNKD